MDYYEDPNELLYQEILEANKRHDSERHSICMDTKVPLRSRSYNNVVGQPLSDKAIDKYASKGYYSEGFREARRELWAMRAAKKEARNQRRDGNFLIFKDGRKVYSPL